MKKNFSEFLNENVTRRFQYSVDKNMLDEFDLKLKEKCYEYEVDVKKHETSGVSKIKVLLTFIGDDDSILEIIEWIKNNY